MVIELPYSEPEFASVWAEWVDYRQEIRKPYKSPKSAQRQLNWFVKQGYTALQAIELIDIAIRNGWMAPIWPDKTTLYGNSRNKQGNTAFKPGTSNARTQGLINW
jgi:hypothetical protein